MIIFRVLVLVISAVMLLAGAVVVLSPDVNNSFLPLNVTSADLAHLIRGYGGFMMALGYFSIRFLYSSSKVEVGNVVFSIVAFMLVSKIFAFIYEGFTDYSIITFTLGLAFAASLFILRKSRKNHIDYNL
tara:strand:+ start:1373 stop:1762 length:390 start_codon:yes stop_codon:yes gene_type:complete